MLEQALAEGGNSAIEAVVEVGDESNLKLEDGLSESTATSSMGWLAW